MFETFLSSSCHLFSQNSLLLVIIYYTWILSHTIHIRFNVTHTSLSLSLWCITINSISTILLFSNDKHWEMDWGAGGIVWNHPALRIKSPLLPTLLLFFLFQTPWWTGESNVSRLTIYIHIQYTCLTCVCLLSKKKKNKTAATLPTPGSRSGYFLKIHFNSNRCVMI